MTPITRNINFPEAAGEKFYAGCPSEHIQNFFGVSEFSDREEYAVVILHRFASMSVPYQAPLPLRVGKIRSSSNIVQRGEEAWKRND